MPRPAPPAPATHPARASAARRRRHPLRRLLAAWPPAPGLLELRAKAPGPDGRVRRTFAAPDDWPAIRRFLAAHRRAHVWFGVALRDGRGGGKRHLTAVPALWADLDQPRIRLPRPVPPPTALVRTGRGAHLYWALAEAVPATPDGLAAAEAALRGLARALGADPAAAEAAHVMRAPGTLNWKHTPPAEARLVRLVPTRRYPLAAFACLAPPTPAAPPAPPRPTPAPRGALGRLFAGCGFLRWARDHQAEVREPLWFAALTNLVHFPGGLAAARALSERYPGFSEREFRAKAAHARTHRPHSCARIAALGSPACPTCPWRGRLRAPASLAWRPRRPPATPP